MKKWISILAILVTFLTFANIYYGNLHSHTSYSDGKLYPEDAYSYAKNYVDVQAVTDHAYYFEQLINGKTKTYLTKLAAEKATVEGEFIALQGFEWTSGIGHINVYESLQWVDRNNVSSMEGFYNWIVEHKKLGQFNHPISVFGTFNDFEYYPQADLYMNLIEVGNGNWKAGDVINDEMLKNYRVALNKGWHLGATVGQDNHKPNWGSANEGRTGIIAQYLSYDDIMSALWSRHTFGTEDKDVKVSFSYGNYIMGDIVKEPVKKVTLHFEYKDYDNIDYFALISQSGTVVEAYPRSDSYSTNITVEIPDGYEWYYCYIKQSDSDEIVTSPIWFQKESSIYVNNVKYNNNVILFDIYNVTSENVEADLKIVDNDRVVTTKQVSFKPYEIKSLSVDLGKLSSGDHLIKFLVNNVFVQSHKIFVKSYKKAVMIDILHENDYMVELKKFGQFLSENGYRVLYSKRMLTNLKDVDVLIISTPKVDGFDFSKDLLAPEIKALSEFDGEIIIIPGSDKTYFDLYKQKINGKVIELESLYEIFGFTKKKSVNKIIIDIGHMNDYGTAKLTKLEDFVKSLGLEISYANKLEEIDGDVLIIQNGKGYSEKEVESIVDFVKKGGKLIITSKSDYRNGGNTQELNYILEKLGLGTKFNDDQVVDEVNNYGARYKILVNGVRLYSPCSLIVGESAKVLLESETAKNEDSDGNGDAIQVDKIVLGVEEQSGLGKVIILGKSIFSDYDFDYNKEFISNIILN